MEAENIFNQNVDFLIRAREEVVQCNQLEAQAKQLQEKEDKMRKVISQEEKSINDEINSTIKKRKSEIEASYDSQLDGSRKKIKKVQEKKNKKKTERVGKRVDEETAEVRENNRQLQTEMKTLFKANHVPGFCRSGLYYSLFKPKGIKEILLLLLFIIIGFAGIPYGMYLLFSRVILAGKPIVEASYFMALVIGITLLLVLGIYFLIFNLTSVKHRDVIAEGRKLRNQILANKKNINAIKNAINKDKDESQYELGDYDQKINQYQAEMDSLAEQKKAALTEFEQNTKKEITDEINSRRLGKLEEMKQQRQAVEEEKNTIEQQLKDATLAITDRYTKYLGKNICKEETLSDIINIMQSEQVETISEGLAIYKGEAPHRVQNEEA